MIHQHKEKGKQDTLWNNSGLKVLFSKQFHSINTLQINILNEEILNLVNNYNLVILTSSTSFNEIGITVLILQIKKSNAREIK